MNHMFTDSYVYYILLDYIHLLMTIQADDLLSAKICDQWNNSYLPLIFLVYRNVPNKGLLCSNALKIIFYVTSEEDWLKAFFIYIHVLGALSTAHIQEAFSVDLFIIKEFLNKSRAGTFKHTKNRYMIKCRYLTLELLVKNNLITSRSFLTPDYNSIRLLNREFKVINTLIKIKTFGKTVKVDKDRCLLSKLESLYKTKLATFNKSISNWTFFKDPSILDLPEKLDAIIERYKQIFYTI